MTATPPGAAAGLRARVVKWVAGLPLFRRWMVIASGHARRHPPHRKPLAMDADPQARKLSCGLVIVNDRAEVLLCHVTGHDHWDLPKGGLRAGESTVEAALRETEEETGLVLGADMLLDLGRLPYRPRKDLHLYALRMQRFDTAGLVCRSRFVDGRGERQPEMDGFRWVPFAQVAAFASHRLAVVLTQRLDLRALLDDLQAREPFALAA